MLGAPERPAGHSDELLALGGGPLSRGSSGRRPGSRDGTRSSRPGRRCRPRRRGRSRRNGAEGGFAGHDAHLLVPPQTVSRCPEAAGCQPAAELAQAPVEAGPRAETVAHQCVDRPAGDGDAERAVTVVERAEVAARSRRRSATLASLRTTLLRDYPSPRSRPSSQVVSRERSGPPAARRSRRIRAATREERWRSTTPAKAPGYRVQGRTPGADG